MKFRLFGLLALLGVFAFVAAAADVTGKWTAEMQGRGGNAQQVTINLKADGGTLTGSLANARGETPISDGKVDGNKVSFNVKRNFNGNEFVQKFKDEFGWERVTDDPIEAAYFMLHLWKMAVEKAGSTDVDKVRAALQSGIEYDAPGGKVKVDPKTQRTYKWFRMGRVRALT